MKHTLLLLLTCLALGACGITDPDCTTCTSSAIAYGRITGPTGAPIAGVQVDFRAYGGQCTQSPGSTPWGATNQGFPVTDAQGWYRARPVSFHDPFTATCFVLTVNPANDTTKKLTVGGETFVISGFTQITGQELRFRDDDGGGARDSARFDFQVPVPTP